MSNNYEGLPKKVIDDFVSACGNLAFELIGIKSRYTREAIVQTIMNIDEKMKISELRILKGEDSLELKVNYNNGKDIICPLPDTRIDFSCDEDTNSSCIKFLYENNCVSIYIDKTGKSGYYFKLLCEKNN